MLDTLLKLIKEYDDVGSQYNSVKAELRIKEFELKNKKLSLEFDEEYANLRDGLKVKEIPNMIAKETESEAKEICELKFKRDDLEHEFKVLGLQIQYTKEVIESQKQ